MELKWLQPEGVQIFYSQIQPLLSMVCEELSDTAITEQGVLRMFYSGAWTCWLVLNEGKVVGVGATASYADLKLRPVMDIKFFGGPGWFEWGPQALETLEHQAKENGIYSVEFEGRDGWTRVLKDYKRVRSVFKKVINDIPPPNVTDVGRA